MNRRNFIQKTAAALAFSIVPRRVLGGAGVLAPSDELTKAVIGVGGMGRWHLG
ncbi:MAG TPA: gfo/Idh/MocA family oxidoreductase, partial [Bacteroidetes bacterium]|nr:gfo/Idh/MocA family oxidoreductase [Bacteroidota bacterium]